MAASNSSSVPPKPPDPKPNPIVNTTKPQKSFAAAVCQGSGFSFANKGVHLEKDFEDPIRRGEWKIGRMVVAFSKEEIQESLEPLKFALVAKFWGLRPSVDEVRYMIKTTWELSEEIFVGVLNTNHLLLRFNNKDDYVKSWLRDVHVIKGISFKVFPWYPAFRPGLESSLAPVWISLPMLPCNLLAKKYIRAVVSGIGRLLAMDQPTVNQTRPSVARVCVEVDLSKPIPHEIDILIGQTLVIQKVIYEKLPLYCRGCRLRGHGASQCPRKAAAMVSPAVVVPKEGVVTAANGVDTAVVPTDAPAAVCSDTPAIVGGRKDEAVANGKLDDGQEEHVRPKKRRGSRGRTGNNRGKTANNRGNAEYIIEEPTKQWVSRVFYSPKKKKLWVPKKRAATSLPNKFDQGLVHASGTNEASGSETKKVNNGNGSLVIGDFKNNMEAMVDKAIGQFTTFSDILVFFPEGLNKKMVMSKINSWLDELASMRSNKILGVSQIPNTGSSQCVIQEIISGGEKSSEEEGSSGDQEEINGNVDEVSNNVNCGELLAEIKVFPNDPVEMEENDGGEEGQLEYPNQNVKVSEDVVNRNLLVKSKSMENVVEACGDTICDRGHASEGEIKKTALVPKEVFVQESSQLIKKLSGKFWRGKENEDNNVDEVGAQVVEDVIPLAAQKYFVDVISQPKVVVKERRSTRSTAGKTTKRK